MATATKKRRRTLPRKLSDLMELALADLAKAERSKNMEIDMSRWLSFDRFKNKCCVCFAGAVMAQDPGAMQLLEDRKNQCFSFPEVCPGEANTGKGNAKKYDALNSVREGFVSSALGELGVSKKRIDAYRERFGGTQEVCDYYDDRKQWRKDMRKIIKQLREFNL